MPKKVSFTCTHCPEASDATTVLHKEYISIQDTETIPEDNWTWTPDEASFLCKSCLNLYLGWYDYDLLNQYDFELNGLKSTCFRNTTLPINGDPHKVAIRMQDVSEIGQSRVRRYCLVDLTPEVQTVINKHESDLVSDDGKLVVDGLAQVISHYTVVSPEMNC